MKHIILVCAVLLSLSANADLPTNSLYQSETQWQTETGKTITLEQLSGKLQVVAFVYTHCTSMCPVIVMDLQKVQKSLSKKQLAKTEFTLISLDSAKDTLDAKREFMREHKLTNWHFLSSSEQDTRELALLFNVRYRNEGNEIIHSNTVSLLDQNGRLIAQRNGNSDLNTVIEAIKKATQY